MSKKSAGSGKKKAKGVQASTEAQPETNVENLVDNGTNPEVRSSQQQNEGGNEATESGNTAAQNVPATGRRVRHMNVTLTRSNANRKDDRLVIYNYSDSKGSVQFLRSRFGETIPDELVLSGELGEPKAPKEKETAEARKARLKALPKLTLAEKVQKAEERTAKLKAKMQAAAAKELVTA